MLGGFGQDPLCLQAEPKQAPTEDPARTHLQLSHSMATPSPRSVHGMSSSPRQDMQMGYHPPTSVQPQDWQGHFAAQGHYATRPSISPTNSPPAPPHPNAGAMWGGSAASGGCQPNQGGSAHPWATLSTLPGPNLPPTNWSQMGSTGASDSPMSLSGNSMHMNSPAMAQGPASGCHGSYIMGHQTAEIGSGPTYAAWNSGNMAPAMPSVQGQIAFPTLSTAPGAMSAHEQSMWNQSQMRADAAPYVPGTYGSGVQAY